MNQHPETPRSRRSFLKTTTAVTASALASPLAAPARAQGAADKRLKLGLISAATYGYMGAPRTPGSHHGTAFSATCNGFDEAKAENVDGDVRGRQEASWPAHRS